MSRATHSTGRHSTTAPNTASSTSRTTTTAALSLDVKQRLGSCAAASLRGRDRAGEATFRYRYTLETRGSRLPARGRRTDDSSSAGRHRPIQRRRCSSDRSCRRSSRRRGRGSSSWPTTAIPHGSRQAAVLVARQGPCAARQLGLGDHHRHFPAEAAVLSALRGERQVDGEDEGARAAHQESAGDVQGRSREARPRDDGAVPAREDQSGRRLPADHHPDPGVPRLLLGAARERGDAPGAFHGLDQRPVLARSVLHPAGHHGRGDVHPVQAESHAAGSRSRPRCS